MLVWWLSTLAFLQSLSAATILADILSTKWAGFFAAFVAALNCGTATYVASVRPLTGTETIPSEVAR